MTRAGSKDKPLVAIGAFDKILVAHFQINFGMSERAAAAVAGDAAVVGFDGFRDLDRHGKVPVWREENRRLAGSYKLRLGEQVLGSRMVRLSKIYTKTGDSGATGLGDNSRISKASPRVTAIGAVDETNAAIGIARLDAAGDSDAMLARIQNDLFDLGADLCMPEDGRKAEGRLRIVEAQVERLEREIDAMNESLEPLTSFILPGGTALAAHLHLARTIARRAEIAMVALAEKEKLNDAGMRYINRLSDHLFVMARSANKDGMGDVLWRPGSNRDL